MGVINDTVITLLLALYMLLTRQVNTIPWAFLHTFVLGRTKTGLVEFAVDERLHIIVGAQVQSKEEEEFKDLHDMTVWEKIVQKVIICFSVRNYTVRNVLHMRT